MTTVDILAALEGEMPTSRRIDVDGWPVPVWVWRLEYPQILEAAKLPRESESEMAEYGLRLVAMAIGDETEPGTFDNERGQQWLRRNPMAALHLAKVVQEFNELNGPSDERLKKSNASEDSSTCVETSESNTQDGCM